MAIPSSRRTSHRFRCIPGIHPARQARSPSSAELPVEDADRYVRQPPRGVAPAPRRGRSSGGSRRCSRARCAVAGASARYAGAVSSELRDELEEPVGRRLREDEVAHRLLEPGERLEVRVPVRVREEPDVEDEVRLERDPVLEPNVTMSITQLVSSARSARWREAVLELADREAARVDDVVGELAGSRASDVAPRRCWPGPRCVAWSGCRWRVSLKRLTSVASLASR